MANRGSFGNYDSTSSQSSTNSQSEFEKISKIIASNIQKMTRNVSDMQRFIGQISTVHDTPELRDQLHKVQHYTNQIAKETNVKIQEISHIAPSNMYSEQRQQKLQRDRLVNDFTSTLNSFQSAQKESAQKEKQCVRQISQNKDPFVDDPFSETDPGQNQLQIEDDFKLMQEREEQIRILESDIVDVNTIFKDLGMLIHEQGEVIDSIEANIENAAVQVDRGTQQLDQARNYQTKARRKKCFCMIAMIVGLLILILVLYFSLRK